MAAQAVAFFPEKRITRLGKYKGNDLHSSSLCSLWCSSSLKFDIPGGFTVSSCSSNQRGDQAPRRECVFIELARVLLCRLESLASRTKTSVPADMKMPAMSQQEGWCPEYYWTILRDFKRPVIKTSALHEGRQVERSKQANTEDAGNLQATLLLSIDNRIMLMENLWIKRGVVNGEHPHPATTW